MPGSPGDDLTRLAEAVSDGDPVDWGAAESNAGEWERRIVRELRIVSEIAQLHRTHPTPLDVTTDLPVHNVWAHLTLREVIGRGAYGTVYRAWDPQLDREVALKLLSEADHRADASVVVEEGRLLAKVRHRGVVTVFGAARADGHVGLWMELIEGRTLEEVLQQQGRFSAREAALIGVDVCEALAAVHSAGLLHRDIKAQNVMRDRSGRIVLMDFGSGRLRELRGDAPVADLAGTPLYMAPELFKGERASVQSDVYSVGVLLYRLVTGSFPVVARSLAEVREGHAQGRVRRLRDERSDLPAAFVHIVERALSPDKTRRYESAGALELALTGLLASSVDVPQHVVHTGRNRSRVWLGAAIAAALVAGTVLGAGVMMKWGPREAPSGPPARFLVPPPTEQDFESFSVSPDGSHVAFTTAGQLWVKPLGSVESRRFASTQGAHDPFWSPDGRWIAFFRQQSLWVVGLSGGEPRVICPAWNAMGGSWGADGTILFAADLGQAVYRVRADGGERTAVRTQGTHGFDLRWPSFIPGRNIFIYSARRNPGGPRVIHVGRLDGDGTDDRPLLESDSNAQVAEGHILFVSQGKLFAQPLDAESLRLTGERLLVSERIPANLYNRADYANFSAAGSSSLPLVAFLGARQVDREIQIVDRRGQRTVLLGPGEYRDLAVSRDGTHLAFEQLDEVTGTRDIWTLDLSRRQATRITTDPDDDIAPVWSADGRYLYFASNRGGRAAIYRRAADGSGEDERVLEGVNHAIPFDVSPDGRQLSFIRAHQRRDFDAWLLLLAPPGTEQPFRASTYREGEPRFSPDGRWLAYSSTDTGDRHVYIERVDRPGPRWQVSERNGREPFWRSDGKEIFYHGPDRMLMAVSVDVSRVPPVLGRPRPLFQLQFRGWDVRNHYYPLPGGERFVMNVPISGSPPAPLTFIFNWIGR